MVSGAPLSTRLGPRQWMAIDAAVSVAMLAILRRQLVAHEAGGTLTVAYRHLIFISVDYPGRDRWRRIAAMRAIGTTCSSCVVVRFPQVG